MSKVTISFTETNSLLMACRYIKEYRKMRKLSQGELADRSGISQSAISKIETCKLVPSLKQVLSLACELKIKKMHL